MFKLLLSLMFFATGLAYGQNAEQKISCEYKYDPVLKMKVYSMTDDMPYRAEEFRRLRELKIEFPGKNELAGKVNMSFVVDTNGIMRDIKIYEKSESKYNQLDKNVIEALKIMKTWKVGKCKGKVVPVRIVIPMHIHWQGYMYD